MNSKQDQFDAIFEKTVIEPMKTKTTDQLLAALKRCRASIATDEAVLNTVINAAVATRIVAPPQAIVKISQQFAAAIQTELMRRGVTIE